MPINLQAQSGWGLTRALSYANRSSNSPQYSLTRCGESLQARAHFLPLLSKAASLTASYMASQTESDEVAALKRRIEELERAVAEHESGAVVEPHLAANKDLQATCTRLRERCEQLERENSTLALALAYRQVRGGGGEADAADDATAEVPG